MKFNFVLTISLFVYFSAFTQYFIYPYFSRLNSKIEFSINNNSIKPYLFDFKRNSNIANLDIKFARKDSSLGAFISPLINLDISHNSTFYSSCGLFSGIYYKKLTFQLNAIQHIIKPNMFYKEKIDSIELLPSIGKTNYKKDQLHFNTQFTYNLHWHTFNYLWFDVGYGKHFLGDGFRSMFLSENSSPFYYLKGTASIWKVKYIVLYSFLNEPSTKHFSLPYTRKNSTLHYLDMQLGKNFYINGFETVIWQVKDSIGNRYIDINYLNPIIFFRPIEFSIGSPDNVILGAGFKIIFRKKWHFYSQFLLDEFKLSEWKTGRDWWGNKFGVESGIKTFHEFKDIKLFGRIEVNAIRPFCYSHSDYLRAWGNMHEPLAHYLGANFIEWIANFILEKKKFMFDFLGIYSRQGESTENLNAGNNIYLSYNYNRQDYGNHLLVGRNTTVYYSNFSIYYLIKPSWQLRIFVKFENIFKSKESIKTTKDNFFSIGLSSRGVIYDRY